MTCERHRRFLVFGVLGFQMFGQGSNDLWHRPTLEFLLLGVSPVVGLLDFIPTLLGHVAKFVHSVCEYLFRPHPESITPSR
jgi:hypothetical protein